MTNPESNPVDIPAAGPEASEVPASPESGPVAGRFGTFQGVFRPTVLTILGALLYVREGWVVGHAGLGGFLIILVAMFVITTCTALCVSSITTNIRLGTGGVFSIVSQAMGLEAGGAIGLPFYLAQSLGGAFYIFAFTEGWHGLFPNHPTLLVAFGVYLVALAVVIASAELAFRVQGVVMLVILAALTSAALGLYTVSEFQEPRLLALDSERSLVDLFAIFFPAATGVLVGATMSGALKDPRHSIPHGTLFAVGVSFAVYLLAGIWYAVIASPDELRADPLIMVSKAAWGPAIYVGLMASTFTATISSMVAAPRLLHALARYELLPGSRHLAPTAANGEPRRATFVTAAIVGLGLLSGSLDAIAPLLTVFFLITYASINFVLFVEQSLGLLSFRPRLRVPRAVPLVGAVGALLGILATSPVFGLLAFALVLAVYVYLLTRSLEAPFETVRSGLFVNIAHWAARRVSQLPGSSERSWKPDLLVPVGSTTEIAGCYRLLRSLTWPRGSLKVIGVAAEGDPTPLNGVDEVVRDLKADGLYASWSLVESSSFDAGVRTSLAALSGALFPPNLVFVQLAEKTDAQLQAIVDAARKMRVGVVIYAAHTRALLGRERTINVWVRDQSPDWRPKLKMASLDLALLLALQLETQWSGTLNLLCAVDKERHVDIASTFLEELREQARLPGNTRLFVEYADFTAFLDRCPHSDINVFGLPEHVDVDWMTSLTERTRSSCLFVVASGRESALA